MSVKEWPEPTALTGAPEAAAAATAAESSRSVVGSTTEVGAHTWLPPQLRQRGASLRGRGMAVVTAWSAVGSATEGAPVLGPGLQGLDELGQDLVHVTDHPQV